jgi:STE24 endopeptidase
MAEFPKGLASVLLTVVFAFGFAAPARADMPPIAAPTPRIEVRVLPPIGASDPATFNPNRATELYLARFPPQVRKRADAYFAGTAWLRFVELIYILAISGILMWTRLSRKMRNLAARIPRPRIWQTPVYVAEYTALMAVAGLPLAWYEGLVRERTYGFAWPPLSSWLVHIGSGFAVKLTLAVAGLTLFYAVVRKTREKFAPAVVAGTVIAVVFAAATATVLPHLLASTKTVFTYDLQHPTANVADELWGSFADARIPVAATDVTSDEKTIAANHAAGHSALHHTSVRLALFGLNFAWLFALTCFSFNRLARRFGNKWQVYTIGDPTGFPVLAALISLYAFLALPLTNAISRSLETRAEYYTLDSTRQPDAIARDALRPDRHCAVDPTLLEKIWFCDQPSSRDRIATAMNWKTAHLREEDIRWGPVSPQ